jgi:hypothetical protein
MVLKKLLIQKLAKTVQLVRTKITQAKQVALIVLQVSTTTLPVLINANRVRKLHFLEAKVETARACLVQQDMRQIRKVVPCVFVVVLERTVLDAKSARLVFIAAGTTLTPQNASNVN